MSMVVTFTNGTPYNVMCPSMDLKKLANSFRKMKFGYGAYLGTSVTNFIREHPDSYLTDGSSGGDTHVQLNTLNSYSQNVVVHGYKQKGDRASARLFSGTLEEFLNWVGANGTMKDAVDKVVRFTYRSSDGTHERLVKITNIVGDGSNMMIKGWDLRKSTAGVPAHRQYKIGNIVGKVEIVG